MHISRDSRGSLRLSRPIPEKEAHKLTAQTDPVPHIQPAKQSSQAPRHNISLDFILLWMIDSAWMIEFDGR